MARSRNIKPALFENEILGAADPLLTLLFEGLWCLADREGRLEDRPLRIKAQIFLYRPSIDIIPMLDWLAEKRFIRRYTVAGVGYIDIPKFKTHQSPHHTERKSVLPEFPIKSDGCTIPCDPPLVHESQTVEIPLIPDSGFTDSLIPDSGSLIPDSSAPAGASRTGATPPKRAKSVPVSGPTWTAYAEAYQQRYGTMPLRNATVNSQLAAFVGRVGAESSPAVAAFYVHHNDRFYVQKQHSVGLMLQNAEGLHTQWTSGRTMTQTTAKQVETRQAALESHNEALEILKSKGYNVT